MWGFSFWSDENVLELVLIAAQLTKNHCIAYFKGRALWFVIYISIKQLFKKRGQSRWIKGSYPVVWDDFRGPRNP